MANESSNFYEQEKSPYIERVVLAQAISFTVPKNTKGKFYFPVMTPTGDHSKARLNKNGSNATSNYIDLIIPANILWGFAKPKAESVLVEVKGVKVQKTVLTISKTTIPAGTEFLIEYLGGRKKLVNLSIIGARVTEDIDTMEEE